MGNRRLRIAIFSASSHRTLFSRSDIDQPTISIVASRVLAVAHSWFHARRRAAPKRAERAARRDRLVSGIREIFEQSKRCYGAPHEPDGVL